MFLATPAMVPWRILLFATLGIALVAGAAAAMNCLIEQKIDAVMARTRGRPLPLGQVNATETLALSVLIGGLGLWLLNVFVNPYTMWLTLATFVGYAIIYTVFLKPNTSQNIVIGGASGAMPPVLGWAAVTGTTPGEAWMLFLIIFVDAAALLEFGAVSNARVCRSRHSNVAGDPRRRVHATTCVSLYRRLELGDFGAICHWHGGLVLPRQRGDSGCGVFGLRMDGVATVQRRSGEEKFSLVDYVSGVIVRRLANRSLHSGLTPCVSCVGLPCWQPSFCLHVASPPRSIPPISRAPKLAAPVWPKR